jgi:two-component system sensor histidine kinase YesM
MLENSTTTPLSKAFLINENDEIICYSGNFKESDIALSRKYSDLFDEAGKYGTWYNIKWDEEKVLIKSKFVANTDWRMVIVIPYIDILSISNKSRNEMLVVILLTSIVAFVLTYIFSYSITKRISQLIKQMKKVETGNFDVRILGYGNDEIGQLQKNFNYLLTKIAMLLDEKYKMGKDLKNTELKALQSQINPHFLYNTLDLINWKSLNKNVPEISRMVQSLAKFYKLSLSNGDEIVTLSNEIEHVCSYMQIQNERLGNRVALIIEIDKSLYRYKVPKIILQPIVENAIFHGIVEKEEGTGVIRISGKLEENILVLVVDDNGVGIPQNRLDHILNQVPDSNGHGYGIKNIQLRIKLHYGDAYGLTYKSKLGVGTRVEIRIPAELGDS